MPGMRIGTQRLARAAITDGDAALPTDDMPPWLAFERRILVKQNAPALLRGAVSRGRTLRALARDRVVIGTATDPYQPAERRFRVTRGILEVLAEQEGLGVTIITKSPLVTRDIDLLQRIHERSRLCVHISLITADRELARCLEPRAPTPEARLRGIARLRAHGIEVGVNAMPVLPGITDAPDIIEELVKALKRADASYVSACALRLRASARDRYLPFIADEFPELAARYRNAYAGSHQLGDRYRAGLRARFAEACARHDLPYGRARGSVLADDGYVSVGAESSVTNAAQFALRF